MGVVNEIVIATWPGGYQLVRTLNRKAFEHRQLTTHPSIRRAEMIGETATLFVVDSDGKTVLQFAVEPDPRGAQADRKGHSLRRNKHETTIEAVYGFLLSFYSLLGLGPPNLDDIFALELEPTDPGPISLQFEASTYLMLGLAPPHLWPLDDLAEHLGLVRNPENVSEWLEP